LIIIVYVVSTIHFICDNINESLIVAFICDRNTQDPNMVWRRENNFVLVKHPPWPKLYPITFQLGGGVHQRRGVTVITSGAQDLTITEWLFSVSVTKFLSPSKLRRLHCRCCLGIFILKEAGS
jgi:hypothetical protein